MNGIFLREGVEGKDKCGGLLFVSTLFWVEEDVVKC